MEKEFLFKCKCGGHVIGINTEFSEKEDEVFISFYQFVEWESYNFWQRIKYVWNILKGNKNYIFDVILSKKDAKELGNHFVNIE